MGCFDPVYQKVMGILSADWARAYSLTGTQADGDWQARD